MNFTKWTNKRHSQNEWFAKLAEEFGEVAREITAEFDGQDAAKTARRLENELEHVEFIAHVWRHSILAGYVKDSGVRKSHKPRPSEPNL